MPTSHRLSQVLSSLAFALAACGDDASSPGPDAASEDAPTADAAPDAAPAPVTVTARNRLVPAANVRIVFLASDDTVIANVVTDATGTATAIVPAGGKIVAMPASQTRGYLWLGVKPGDAIALDLGATTTEAATIVVPAGAGTTAYLVETGCTTSYATSSSTTITLSLVPGCTTTDVAIYRNVVGQLVDALVLRDQPLTAGSTLDLSGQTYTPVVQHTVDVTDVPATFPYLVIEGSLALALEPQLTVFRDFVQATGSSASVSGKLPDVNAALISGVLARSPSSAQSHLLLRRGGSGPLAIGAAKLPDLTAPLFDAPSRTATWAQGPGGQAPDGAFADLQFAGLEWLVAGPAATSFTIPALPAELAPIDPATHVYQRGEVRAFAVTGGFDAARPRMFAITSPRGLLPADGQIAISDSGALDQ